MLYQSGAKEFTAPAPLPLSTPVVSGWSERPVVCTMRYTMGNEFKERCVGSILGIISMTYSHVIPLAGKEEIEFFDLLRVK